MGYSPEYHYLDQVFPGDVQFTGTIGLPTGSLTSAMVASAANVAEAKLQHRVHIQYNTPDGTDITTLTTPVFLAYKGCTVLAVQALCIDNCAGGDKKFTVDVQKSTAGGAAASILTAALDFASKTDLTTYSATLSGTPTLVATDMLQVVTTVSGSTGDQGQGLIVDIVLKEDGA
jgi:hypothetical protein